MMTSSEFWASFVQRFQTYFFIAWAVKKQAIFLKRQVRSSCRWYGCAARENTTSGILSTGIVVQGTWLMLRSIWLFFHFCWLQITVLKVSSIIIPVDSHALWSHNWRGKAHANSRLAWLGVFALRNWKLISVVALVMMGIILFISYQTIRSITHSEWVVCK